MTKLGFAALILGAGLVPGLASADDYYGPHWRPELGMEAGLTAGGGNLMDPGMTGQPTKTPSNVYLASGDTFYLQGYYRQAIGETGLSVKAAVGGTYACMAPACIDVIGAAFFGGSNVSIGTYQFDNLSSDLALEYAWQDARIGIGRTFRAVNLLVSNSSVYSFDDIHLKPAQGWFLEYEVGKVGWRYTHIIYRSSVSGETVNGSNFGVYTHFSFNDEDWVPGGWYYHQGEAMARESLALVFHPKEWGF